MLIIIFFLLFSISRFSRVDLNIFSCSIFCVMDPTHTHTPRVSYICVIRINKIYMARCMIRYQTRSAYHYCFSSLAIQNEQRWKWSTIRNDEHHQNFLTSQLYNRIYPHIPVFELVNKKRSFSFFLFHCYSDIEARFFRFRSTIQSFRLLRI